MSSLAYAPAAARRSAVSRALANVAADHGSDVLLGVAIAAITTVMIGFLPSAFNVDSWLALVTGRDVSQHGIPAHETLTAIAYGKSWIDQQWLSQLASYGLFQAGGLALLGLINVALYMLGVGGAVVCARRLGAPARAVMVALPLAAWLLLPSREVRTQAFAIPLFVATAYMLARDSREPSRRVYWSLPLLVAWANLHGSVTIGVMLVIVRALTLAFERRSKLLHSAREWVRPLVLLVAAPLTLLATPYGLRAVPYYKTMLFSSALRKTVTEWQPITAFPGFAVGFAIASAVVLWALWRHRSRTTLWDRVTLVALIAGAFTVNRNALFFGLALLILLPVSLNIGPGKRVPGQQKVRINVIVSLTAAAALLLAMVATIARPSSSIELSYQRTAVLSTVERATSANPSLKVFADVRFADWLLWRDQALAGRVGNDARFELLTPSQLNDLHKAFEGRPAYLAKAAEGYGLVVADRTFDRAMVGAFLREPGARVLYNDGERIVILRAGSEAL